MTHRLVCFPFAGAGASVYRRGWRSDSTFEVSPVRLPHREDRLSEPPYTDLASATEDLVRQVRDMEPLDGYVFFGHSMGAFLAAETAIALQRLGMPSPVLVVVSGSLPPMHRTTESPLGVDDDVFIRAIERDTGYRSPALQMPELRPILVPTLRADVDFLSRVEPTVPTAIAAPLLVLRGTADKGVPKDEWSSWSRCTVAGTTFTEFEGGHMFLLDQWDDVRRAIAGELS